MIQFFIYKTLIMPSLLLIHAPNQHLYGELVYNMFLCIASSGLSGYFRSRSPGINTFYSVSQYKVVCMNHFEKSFRKQYFYYM